MNVEVKQVQRLAQCALMVFMGISLLRAHAVLADSWVVGNGTPSSCTEAALRAAIANGGLITFDCGSVPYTILVTNELIVSRDTILDGGGQITLSGGNLTRILHANDYVSLTVQNLTVRDGKGPAPDGSGGGLRGGYRGKITVINCLFTNNDGTSGDRESGGGAIFVKAGSMLFVSNSTFVGNRGSNGGAINNLLSNMTVINSIFMDNDSMTLSGKTSQGEGGAIYTDGASEYIDDALGGQIIIRDSTFIGNHSRGQGGAVFSWVYPPDVIVIDNTHFLSNTVTVDPISRSAALGGGLRVGNGQLFLSHSVFAYNVARSQGGAFWTEGNYPASLTNITFAHNRAVGDDNTGMDGLGGALAGGNWACTNCTIASNHAGFLGGGIFGSTNISLANTIIAYNTAFNNGNPWNIQQNCSTRLNDGGQNLQFPAQSSTDPNNLNCTANITIADAKLNPLADNGGFTLTRALQAGSPAIDAGNPATCPAFDQRRYIRGRICDIGAYEFDGIPFSPTNFAYLPLINQVR